MENRRSIQTLHITDPSLLRKLIEQCTDLFLLRLRDGRRIVECSPAFSENFGVFPNDDATNDISRLLADNELNAICEYFLNIFRRPHTFSKKTIRFVDKNGNIKYFQVESALRGQDEDDREDLYILLLDQTDFSIYQKKLETLVDKNALQTQSLLNFAYTISHNLRSHVANMLSLFELNELGLADSIAENGGFLKLIKSNLEKLDASIKDLNSVVHFHSGPLGPKKVIDVAQSVAVVLNSVMAAIYDARATVVNTIRPSSKLRTIPSYFESIFLNLLTNAIKYRHPDRNPIIKISFYNSGGFKVLEVKDNGLGIDLNRYGDKIFNIYRTFHGNADAKGLGLYLCRVQAEAMGGNISVVSVPGKGSTFKVFFYEGD